MAGKKYKKYVKRTPVGTDSPDSPSKRARIETATEGAASDVMIVSTSAPPPPPNLEGSSRESVTIDAGHLWSLGVSEGIRAVVRAPPELNSPQPLGTRLRLSLAQIEEVCMKASSLVPSFIRLHADFEASASNVTALTLQNTELTKAKEKAEADAATTVAGLRERLEKAEADLKTRDLQLTQKDERIRTLEAEYEEARGAVEEGVVDAFENAVNQLKVLNPNLVTEGIDLLNTVKNGQIVPDVDEDESALAAVVQSIVDGTTAATEVGPPEEDGAAILDMTI